MYILKLKDILRSTREKIRMNEELFANGKVSKVFVKFAIPSILTSLLMISTYLVDGILIGRFIGPEGLASFNLVFPVFSFIGALGFVIATGGSAIIGKYLGANRINDAKQVFNLAIFLGIIFSVVLTGITLVFADSIAGMLGATDVLFDGTRGYFAVLAIFFPLYIVGIVLQFFIRNEGDSIFPIKATMVSVVINIPMTYVFLAVWGWGLDAAALGSGLSLIPSTALLVFFFLRKKAVLSYGKPIFDFSVVKKILYNGSSEGLSEMSMGIVVLIFNLTLIQYLGEIGVAAFAIISLTSLVMLMIGYGLSMALQPIISYHYGSKSIQRLKDTLKISIKVAVIGGAVYYAVVFALGDHFISLFNDGDVELTALAFDAIRIYGISYLFIGVNMLCSGYLTALGRPKLSLIISLSFNFIFVLIGLLAFPPLIGASGIWWALPFAHIASIFVSFYLVKKMNRSMV